MELLGVLLYQKIFPCITKSKPMGQKKFSSRRLLYFYFLNKQKKRRKKKNFFQKDIDKMNLM